MPLAIVVGLFVLTARAMAASDPPADREPDLVVIGHQWWWEARYPQRRRHRQRDPHPRGQGRCSSRVESADVIHDFWVPAARAQDRRDPRAPDLHLAAGRRAGHLPRRVRGVLRRAARLDAHRRRRASRRQSSTPGSSTSSRPRRAPDERAPPRAAQRVFARRDVRQVPRHPRRRAARRASAPDLTHLAARSDPRRRRPAEHARETSRAGCSDPQVDQARAATCPTCNLTDDEVERSRRLLRDAPMSLATVVPLEHAPRTRTRAEERGAFAWVATVDHKRIGILYLCHGALLLRASAGSRRSSCACSSRGRTHARRRRTRSTSSSRCTARR